MANLGSAHGMIALHYRPQQNITIELTNERAIAHAVNILMMETTLFSPWWFTGGTNQAFVEIGNTTNMALEPVVTFDAGMWLWSSLIRGSATQRST